MIITTSNVTPEIARIHAHVCGDGFVYLSKEHRSPGSLKKHPRRNLNYYMWILAYSNTCQILIKEFKRDLKKALNRKGLYRPKYHEIRIRGAKHLIENLQLKDSTHGRWFIPDFIINAPEKIICNWLRAFFDDEGSVGRYNIFVYNMNRNGMFQVLKLLEKIGIETKVRQRKDNCYVITILSAFVPIYFKKIGFIHPKKKMKLKKLVMGRERIEPSTPRYPNSGSSVSPFK